ncbi:MAG: rhomboid family intramembrane serine protease [Solirubrobacteraceae bacterium]
MFEPRRPSRPSRQIRPPAAPTTRHRAAPTTAGHRPARRRPLGRCPATATITSLTAAVGGAQFIWPDLVARWRRDGARLHDREWWRLVTPLLVQPDGLGQYAYNLTGSVLVGVAVERRHGHTRCLACYLASGLAGNLAAYRWQPHANGGGSSDAVAGLIGALAMTQLQDGALPRWPAYLYTAHFAAYLTVLDTTSYQTAALAGAAALAAATTARHRLPARPLSRATATAVIAAATAMTALRDPHGVGLLSGLALTCLDPRVRTPPPARI